MGALSDLTGGRYGRLVVKERVFPNTATNGARWLCHCDCGGTYTTTAKSLKNGTVESCGCLRKESARRVLREHVNVSNHGMTDSMEYRTWCAMKSRCGNVRHAQFEDYGGRFIQVCERWLNSFENFYSDMGPKPSPDHSIERRDVNGDYTPENCYWATSFEQANNTRSNVRISHEGTELTQAQWARELDMSPSGIKYRLEQGIDLAAPRLRKFGKK